MRKILVIDVGGTNLKLLATGRDEPVKIPSGPAMTGMRMIEAVRLATADWEYDVISIGYPGPVVGGKPARDPWNLAPGWVAIDFEQEFGKPVKILNDAAMQALGSFEGGRMLFLGLGTGLGSTLVLEHAVAPMELAHLPFKRNRTFEDYVGQRGLDRLGKKKWRRAVADVVAILKAAVVADYVVLGGGNARRLDVLPNGARLGSNQNAFRGGFRMWEPHAT